MSRDATRRRDAMKLWLIDSALLDAKLNDVIARLTVERPFGDATWIPDPSTVFRLMRALRAERTAAGGPPVPQPRGRTPTNTAAVAVETTTASARLLQRLPEHATREAYVERITALKAAATALHDQLADSPQITPALGREYKSQMTWTKTFERGERGRRGTFALDGVQRRYEELRALVGSLTVACNAHAVEQVSHAPSSTAASLVVHGSQRPSVMPFATSRRDSLMQVANLGARTRPTFGEAIATTNVPPAGAVVRYADNSKAHADAAIRALMIEPILTGRLKPRRAALLWRNHFRGLTTTDEITMLADIPVELMTDARNRYHTISDKTLAKWCRRVHSIRAQVDDAASVAPIMALLHVKRPSATRREQKLTPEIAAHIRRHFLRQDDVVSSDVNAHALISVHNVNATMITEWLADTLHVRLSPRTVQRYVARKIADAERLVLRGGSEGQEFLRLRMIREAPYPNHTVIMDHSFFLREKVDTLHPEWQDTLEDFNFQCAFKRRTHNVGHVESYHTVQKMSMTLIVDAHTRRKLAMRVFEGTPSTADTLVVLHDAITRFGVPENLYTDNGSDFTSRRMLASLQALGIRSVKSRPHCPQGRGTIERDFRTIKESILPTMTGFLGNLAAAPPSLDELDDHETFEAKLWDRVNTVMNNRVHSETGRVPSQHFDESIGASVLQRPPVEAMLGLLSVRRDVVRHSLGVSVFGGRYTGPGLFGIPEKARVVVHGDPYRPQLVHVSTYGEDGNLRYRGPVERYGAGGAEAPQHDVFEAQQHEWRLQAEVQTAERRVASATRARRQLQLEDGEILANALSDAVQDRVRQLSAGDALASGSVDRGTPVANAAVDHPNQAAEESPLTAPVCDGGDRVITATRRSQSSRASSRASDAPVRKHGECARNSGDTIIRLPWES
jgi:transposase InsO family protein